MSNTTKPELTDNQTAQILRLAHSYTNECNTGTGQSAEDAENKLGAYLKSLGL